MDSDRALVARVRAGDGQAFQLLMARHRPALVRFAASRLGYGRQDAEDVVQDASVRAYEALRRGADPPNPTAWLFTIVRNRAADLTRSRQRRPIRELDATAVCPRDEPAVEIEHRDRVRAAMAAIGELPERQREALVGVAIGGASYEEMAVAQDTSVKAVKALVNRARTAVRQAAAAFLPPILGLRERLLPLRDHLDGVAGAAMGKAGAVAAVSAIGIGVAGPPSLPLHQDRPDGPAAAQVRAAIATADETLSEATAGSEGRSGVVADPAGPACADDDDARTADGADEYASTLEEEYGACAPTPAEPGPG